MGFDSGLTSVTGNVNAVVSGVQTPGTSQTHVHVQNVCNGAVQTGYTVTAGKTFYLYGVQGGTTANGNIMSNGDTKTIMLVTQLIFYSSMCPIAVYTTAQNVRLSGTNAQSIFFWGVEQ